MGNAGRVLSDIREVGFLPEANVSTLSKRSGMAIRWLPALTAGGLWWGAFITDIVALRVQPPNIGPFSTAIICILPVFCTVLLKSEALQNAVIKPGRSFLEIRASARLLWFISLMMAPIVFGMFLFK